MPIVDDTFLARHRVDPAALAAAPLIGVGHVETELASLAARLANPELAERLGATVPTGLLLHGPAGIGKTHTARALGHRLGDIPMYSIGADELTGPVVRGLFAALARRHDRAILVVDEIDLVGGERSETSDRRVLSALLTELDGLRAASGVLVVAASSRPAWELDQALTRAGRLGFVIELGYPDRDAREALARHYLLDRPVTGDIDWAAIAESSIGWTPAELKAACADAAGLAMLDGRASIGQADIARALKRAGRVLPEPAAQAALDRALLARVCAHEASHAVAIAVTHGVAWIAGVGVGQEQGYVKVAAPSGRDAAMTEHDVRDEITVALAGIAGERILLGAASMNHQDDVERAYGLARRLVVGGLEASVPPVDLEDIAIRGSAAASRAFDAAAARLAAAREAAAAIVSANRDLVATVARWLEDEASGPLGMDPRPEVAELDPARLRALVADGLALRACSRGGAVDARATGEPRPRTDSPLPSTATPGADA